MRFMHLSDLHIGKRVNEFSMLADQQFILQQIVDIAKSQAVGAVVIAGDVYDKPIPSVEALKAFEQFLLDLSGIGVPIIAVAGNHDSAERLSFGSLFMEQHRIHIARAFSSSPQSVQLEDAAGPVCFHLLPFVRPIDVRLAYPDSQIATYEDAVREAVSHMELQLDARHVLVAHQFVTSGGAQPQVCDSETIAVGGVDNVDASLFDAFSYVALGHLHGRQSIGRPEVRYCGSPLKYSFSEATQKKTISIVDLDAAGKVAIEEAPLAPLHDMREVSGAFEDLRNKAQDEGIAAQDYLHVTLEGDHLMDAMAKVRAFYPNVMRLDFSDALELEQASIASPKSIEKSMPELFADFYEAQLGARPDAEQQRVIEDALKKIEEAAK